MKVFTKEEFEAYTPKQKGYAVYMCGMRDDQPNIPNEHEYKPDPKDQAEFDEGIWAGILLQAQDDEN